MAGHSCWVGDCCVVALPHAGTRMIFYAVSMRGPAGRVWRHGVLEVGYSHAVA